METDTSASEQLEQFIDDLLVEKNLPGLTGDAREVVAGDLRSVIEKLINQAIVDALPEDSLRKFDELLDNPDVTQEKIEHVIDESGIDVTRITSDTLLRFRELYLQESIGDSRES